MNTPTDIIKVSIQELKDHIVYLQQKRVRLQSELNDLEEKEYKAITRLNRMLMN